MKKVVLITGASSGFGKFTALKLIEQGYIVYGVARRLEMMKVLEEKGGHTLKMDVTDLASIQEGVSKIIQTHGHIDVLINNAGYGAYGFVETCDLDQMRRMFDVNLWGLAQVTQEVLPHMRSNKSGRIINITSVVGKVSIAYMGFYAATKHAVEALSDALRQEVSRFGIQVSIIEPGTFQTGFEGVVLEAIDEEKELDAYQKTLKRFLPAFTKMYEDSPTPEPVVKAILKAIEKRKPKIRYRVGSDSKFAIFAKGIISDRLYDKILLRQIKLDK